VQTAVAPTPPPPPPPRPPAVDTSTLPPPVPSAATGPEPGSGLPTVIIRLQNLPRARLSDIWSPNPPRGQRRQLVVVLPGGDGGASAVTVRGPQSLEATLMDQPFTARVSGSSDTGFFALDGADVRQRFNELIDDLRGP